MQKNSIIRFERCCENSNKINYDIKHDPKPIELVPQFRECIERLLWYVPGINSVQSYNNYLLDNPVYSEVIFDMILDTMKMHKSKDVKIIYGNIDKEEEMFYKNQLCVSCNKMIFNRIKNYNGTGKEETITRAMLRHLRNAIAHGNFKVINNLAYFNDISNKGDSATAIIKIDIISLYQALEQIENNDGITQEKILLMAFEKLGFKVERQPCKVAECSYIYADMIVEKEGKRYAIDIKDYRSSSKLIGYQDELINKIVCNFGKSNYNYIDLIPVIVCDEIRVSDKAKNRLREEKIILLDKKDISKLSELSNII